MSVATNKTKTSGRECLGYVITREIDGVTQYWSDSGAWSDYILDACFYHSPPECYVKAIYAEVEP